MKKSILILVLFITGITNAQTENFPQSRPAANLGPTKVFVSLYIIDIEDIDDKDQSFTADIVVRLKWTDQRLAGIKGTLPLNAIWHPNIQIFNLRDVDLRFPQRVSILDGATVQYTQRYYARFSNHLDFKEFPFDEQILSISLLAFGFTPAEVEMIFEIAGGTEKFSISDWKIEAVGAENSTIKADLFNDGTEVITRPKLDYQLRASRHIQYYWWKVLAPLMVILFLSWAVFWIDPAQVGAQIGVAGTSILTLIAFLFRLENLLPPVSYLTNMDHFIFAALVLVFVAYLEALVSTTFALKGKKEFALKLDFLFRIAYPVVFLLILYIFWVK
ncbi:MAG: hypothetical protein L3J66_09490 [Bacteroidales bacterium]|nr:hypothetical protein [Bacteroidales bacterium]